MRKILIILIVTFTTNTSCKMDDDNELSNTCNVDNPVEDLIWLKEKIKNLEQSSSINSGDIYISQVNYEGNTIFILGNCCELYNSVSPVYNCKGELISRLGCGDGEINFKILEKDIIIWSPPNFKCKDSEILICE